MDNENIFDESIAHIAPTTDDDHQFPEGQNGPTYQLNFGKNYVRVLLDKSIKAEIPTTSFRPEFSAKDYKSVVAMMQDLKIMRLEDWTKKYFVE